MQLKLYNTLTRKKEIFNPIKKGEVSLYSCGPTVYWYQHIGNLRSTIFYDLLKRSLVFLKYNVKHTMNITDVDDKTIRESMSAGESLNKFTKKYEKIFLDDLKRLNIIKPTMLRATESIDEIVKIIKSLMKKGYAYKADDGIYFSVEKSKNYGKLAGLSKIKVIKNRVKDDEYDKENIKDFALWKFYTEKDGKNYWDVGIGKGRPGWHIECSAMSMKSLGETIDIHTGGMDLIFPHHTNEIAQSEASTGKKFVKYWIHAGFLNIGEKMSKSKGNILTLKDLKEKGFNPLDFRYMCLTTHYKKPLDFSMKNLESAKNSYKRLRNIISEIKDDKKTNKKYLSEFEKNINNNLDIPNALQTLWKLVKDKKIQGKFKTIKEMDSVLGLDLTKKEKIEFPKDVKKFAEERKNLRKKKEWKKADGLRKKINELGYIIEDNEKSYVLKKK